MTQTIRRFWIRVAVSLGLATVFISSGLGQALPTASRPGQISAFVLAGGVFTGLGGFGLHEGLGGRNVGVTAGVDYAFYTRRPFEVKAEVRGTYPIYWGKVDGQKNLLGGLRIEKTFERLPRFRVYGDVLAGSGEMQYVDGGYVTSGHLYAKSFCIVYDAGGGFEIDYKKHIAFVGEAQLQHWRTPVTLEGNILAKTGSGGVVYRF